MPAKVHHPLQVSAHANPQPGSANIVLLTGDDETLTVRLSGTGRGITDNRYYTATVVGATGRSAELFDVTDRVLINSDGAGSVVVAR